MCPLKTENNINNNKKKLRKVYIILNDIKINNIK